ncbi:MAG: Glycosyl transferase family 2 [Microgenomates group bacterium GW2011_GWA1_48_10]|uniref:Glycosyltransferase 2-like domain-containing protein n=1 Tax=Candidatus Gottesmanbacteria bacterium RIFCSPHIGHO2_01_FULL_47_48 TaxID=1798381 RepID=A0A1F6A4Z2_9BACT|nr:MAG: Glycosyl transferase family 2 [Microgenomates group bacterium GW2011_GWA1_48_10]OGG19723.1 MAG: hypothetical protein A2721_01050 [Candidatus Gottesmanbacteria bacterium RIFCSPHIGHO2_01_FULL_47_48]
MQSKLFLSIVIPAFNETVNFKAGVLKPSFDFLRKQKFSWEVIFVDDGSTDETYKLLIDLCHKNKNCRVLRISHGGRAAAMAKGMLEARGKYVLYTDFDQSTSLDQVVPFIKSLKSGYDVAIGSRGYGTTVRYDSILNKVRAGVFARLSRALLLPGIVDTSCGFKLYTNDAAKKIFSSLKVSIPRNLKDAYMGAVDTEILFLARRFGFRIDQIPVNWVRRPGTRLNVIMEVSRIMKDMFLLKYYALSGKYE